MESLNDLSKMNYCFW